MPGCARARWIISSTPTSAAAIARASAEWWDCPRAACRSTRMAEFGHTFASDLVINYAEMRREGRIRPGQLLLFASAGIGFTWGVTLARA